MRFQITIKQQAQAINGKAKYPLYKPRGQKNFDQQYGIETLQQLIENSSIKIYCNQCLKEITLQTVVVAYQDVSITSDPNQTHTLNQQTKNLTIPITSQNIQPNQSQIKSQTNKLYVPQKQELFQQKESDSNQDPNQQMKNQHLKQIQQIKMEEQKQALLSKQTQKPKQTHQPTFLYCVGCFASLQEFPSSYSIRKSLKVAPKESKWRIIDEVCLLNGLKFWGFGNWGQIKQFMDYNACPFTVKQIQIHYEQVYLSGDGPFSQKINKNSEGIEYSQFYRPQKRLIEQIMHNYYYPPESEKKLGLNSRQSLQNSLKRQRPVEFDEQQQKLDLVKTSSHKGLPSKHPRSAKTLLFNINNTSHTSLMNVLQKQQQIHQNKLTHKNNKQEYKSQEQNDDNSQQQQQQELLEQEEELQNEIKLKPKASHILLSSSMKVNNNNSTSGKFINQPLIMNRSQSIKPQSTQKIDEKNNTKQRHTQSQPAVHPKFSNLKGHNVYSYNPKRKQFEIIEYDYYAQSMIAQLQFSQDDTQEEQLLKIKIIEEYNRRLDERIKRRQFVIEHRLLDTDFMIKTLQKYNKNNVQKFQPFRRLVNKHQDYFQIVQTYDTLCKTKALTQGLMKVKRKLKHTIKNPKFKDVLQYLSTKKQKKQLLGQRGKFDKQRERRILTRQSGNKINKKMVLSMSQNNSNYINCPNISQSPTNTNQVQGLSMGANRRMTSRSQQRQRLRSHIHKQGDSIEGSNKMNMEDINLSSKEMKMNNQLLINSSSLQAILNEEEMTAIEKMVKREEQQGENKCVQVVKPIVLKNYTARLLKYALKSNQ